MRLLLFLIFGTILFGAAFPALILIVGFFLVVLVVLAVFSFFTGAFGKGGHVIIFKNGRRVDTFGGKRNDPHTADNPEIITKRGYFENGETQDFGEDCEPETVELPPSALSKENSKRDGQ